MSVSMKKKNQNERGSQAEAWSVSLKREAPSLKFSAFVRLTRRQVHPVVVAGRSRHVDADRRPAVLQGDLQGAVVEVAEQEEPVRVPRAELEAERYGVVARPARQLQEAGGVEEDREGVSLHAGEGQVALSGHREEVTGRSEGKPENQSSALALIAGCLASLALASARVASG